MTNSMADQNAGIDQNSRSSLLGVTDDVSQELRRLLVDPVTGRLLVQGTVENGITGPGSSTDNAIVRWDGTAGTTVQNSTVAISDTGAFTGITTLNGFFPAYTGADKSVASANADFTTVQGALDDGGDSIYISDETFAIGATLKFKSSSTKVQLSGGAVLQNDGAVVSPLFSPNTTGLGRIELHGGKFSQTNATKQGVGLDLSDMPNFWISHLRLENYGTPIQITDAVSSSFYSSARDVQLFDNINGVVLAGTQPNLNLWDNVRVRCVRGGGGTGFDLTDTRGNVFLMCDAEPGGPGIATGVTGFHLHSTTRDCLFLGCWIENNDNGLVLDSGADNNLFIGGSITANTVNITDNGSNNAFWGVNLGGTKLFRVPKITDVTGAEILKFSETPSAVNELTITNAAASDEPSISATGDDSNISINLIPKGTGTVTIANVVVPTISSTATLTNKRITKRLVTTNAPGATPTTNSDTTDIRELTGLATAITSMTTNLSGTPVNGDMMEFVFLDNGTARAITWGASFADGGLVPLPTTTVISTVLRVLVQYQTIASLNKWVAIAVA